jgi:hypothetical protein
MASRRGRACAWLANLCRQIPPTGCGSRTYPAAVHLKAVDAQSSRGRPSAGGARLTLGLAGFPAGLSPDDLRVTFRLPADAVAEGAAADLACRDLSGGWDSATGRLTLGLATPPAELALGLAAASATVRVEALGRNRSVNLAYTYTVPPPAVAGFTPSQASEANFILIFPCFFPLVPFSGI